MNSFEFRMWAIMSVELPETLILAEQMTQSILGKKIKSCNLQDYQKLQRVGFINRNLEDYDRLSGCIIKSIAHRGNVIRLQMNKKMNLVLCPDYGAEILFHKDQETLPKKHHLKVDFSDGSYLTVRQTGMGLIYSASDNEIEKLYVIKREFSDIPSPVGEPDFTIERFSEMLDRKSQNVKAALVGKTAVVVGLSNAAFQEIIYKARIHPKRNTFTFTKDEKNDLFDSMKQILNTRICNGGKEKWVNLYGQSGRYIPVMGPNMRGKVCPECGTAIEKIAHGGGQVFFCPHCQR
jgi:formamidopyrimidine-DNA glycosylase